MHCIRLEGNWSSRLTRYALQTRQTFWKRARLRGGARYRPRGCAAVVSGPGAKPQTAVALGGEALPDLPPIQAVSPACTAATIRADRCRTPPGFTGIWSDALHYGLWQKLHPTGRGPCCGGSTSGTERRQRADQPLLTRMGQARGRIRSGGTKEAFTEAEAPRSQASCLGLHLSTPSGSSTCASLLLHRGIWYAYTGENSQCFPLIFSTG